MTPDDGNAWQAGAGDASRSLIERYQEVAQLSREMLAAAHREDWDEFARLERRCWSLIERLKRAAMIEPLNPIEQERRFELLRDILRDDAQIRLHAEPWLLELERLIGMPRRVDPAD
jgi:flagellar protein FliT